MEALNRKLRLAVLFLLCICILTLFKNTYAANLPIEDSDKLLLSKLDVAALSEVKKEKGLRNLEPHSMALLDRGIRALNDGRKIEAITFFKNSVELSPDLPQSYLYLAKINFSLSPKGLTTTIGYLRDTWKAILNNFWCSFRTAGTLLIGLYLSLYVSIIGLFIVLIISKFPLFMHDVKEDRKKLFLLTPSIILVIFGPVFGIFAFILPFWVYMKKRERVLLYTLFAVTAVIILTAPFFTSFLNAPSDVKLRNIVNINNGLYTGDTMYLLDDSDDYESAFTYAMDLKRKGNYKEAIKVYTGLIGKHGGKADAKIYNNIANCFVGLKDNKTAISYYNKALQTSEIASAYYNLSQINREFFNFTEAQEYYKKALAIEPEKIHSFAEMRGTSVNSFVMDETLSIVELWSLAFKRTSTSPYRGPLERMLSFTNRWISVLLILLIVMAFTAYNKRSSAFAYRCMKCGSIYCDSCEKKLARNDMCNVCYKTLMDITKTSSRERVARIVEIHRHRDDKNQRLKIMTLILPGSGHIFYGWTTYGFFIMFASIFFLNSAFIWTYFIPSVSMTQMAALFRWISVTGFVIIYIITVLNIFRKVPRRWL